MPEPEPRSRSSPSPSPSPSPAQPIEPEPGALEARLEPLVREALARGERGERVDPVELAGGDAELAAALAEALGLRDRIAAVGKVADRDPFAGRVLAGRYRLESCLGRGAMGVVYGGRDLELGRDVAVKLFAATLGGDARAEQRFEREAEALAAIRHEHVVAVFDRGRTGEGLRFVVMERLDGATLAELLHAAGGGDLRAAAGERIGAAAAAREPTGARLAVRIAADVAAALEAAHARGVVHRDVKPSNVFVRRDGRAVLLDFGIAARADTRDLTQTGATLGTPWYMAPEQARGDAATPATDVYGLGATLYHALTGRPPFDGDPAAVVARLPIDEPPRPDALVPGLARDLVAILDHALAKERGRRYASAGALGADLRAQLASLPVSVRPWPAITRIWRRILRAPAKPLAAVAIATALLSAAIVLPVLRDAAERERAAARRQLEASLPPLLALEAMPSLRDRIPVESRAADLRLLDRLVALAPDDLAARVHRAALRLDDGDPAGARADLAGIGTGDPYLDAVRERFARAEPARRGVGAIDWNGLPPPATAAGRYVAGFDLLRRRAPAGYETRAVELLRQAAGELPEAQDLLLVALANEGERLQKLDRFTELGELAAARARQLGQETARTLAWRALALIVTQRHADAIAPLRDSDRLCPYQHGTLQNLGVALQRTNRLAEALAVLERARAVRPFFSNTPITIARVLRDQRRFDEALALAASLPQDDPERLAWQQPELVGQIRLAMALAAGERQDRERVAADGALAIESFAAAAAAAPPNLRTRMLLSRDFSRSLIDGDRAAAVARHARLLRSEPNNAYAIANLALLLPETGDLDQASIHELRRWLAELAATLAPGDEDFVARQKQRAAGR